MDTHLDQVRWFPQLINNLRADLRDDPFWSKRIRQIQSTAGFGLHMAVFIEPYLRYILEGKKTVESRFGISRRAPFGYVKDGDVLLLKRSGGPIAGICQVGQVWYFELDTESWRTIKERFAAALCAQDPAFWRDRSSASFATLMLIREVRMLTPFEIPKRDRRGWVMFNRPGPDQGILFA